MKKNYLKIVAAIMLTGASVNILAQDEITQLVKAGADDMETLTKNYISPFGKGLSAHLANNWYNTAATHKILGFDITIAGGVAFVPESDKMFTITNNTFKSLQLTTGTTAQSPTFAGSTDKGPELVIMSPATTLTVTDPNTGLSVTQTIAPQELAKFNAPPGTSLSFVPSLPPSAHLCVGLPFGTEVYLRWIPQQNLQGFKAGLFGFALKHNFKQWIPAISEMPFDMSALFGYTTMNMSYEFGKNSIKPSDLGNVRDLVNNDAYWSDQKFELGASAWTFDVIVSKKLLFFTPYLGLGYSGTSFNLGFKGHIPVAEMPITNTNDPDFLAPQFDMAGNITNIDEIQKPVVRQSGALVDPLDKKIPNGLPHATVGFRLKILWVLALHAQYTFQEYPVATVGFGLNIR